MTREERLELLKQIEKDIHVCSLESTLLDDAKSCAIHSAIEELEQEPRKGHWEHGKEINKVYLGQTLVGINYLEWHCSNCAYVVKQSIKPKWDYCPNCGAKMAEQEET